jgi:hypothetical protein
MGRLPASSSFGIASRLPRGILLQYFPFETPTSMSQPVPGWESTPDELLEPIAQPPPLERQHLDLRRMEQNVERYEVPQVALAILRELHIRALPVTLDPAGGWSPMCRLGALPGLTSRVRRRSPVAHLRSAEYV